ncbi:MAG TPA: serine hydrolase [Polyangiaceae bacterium]|jgi:D-alanyl-D-alanine carboxypeptidase|nr:serine hydrolase [Polyangiaceae bacterium]HOD24402.1 serine hydrolase [Polyangiaceae bacterium]HOE49956.1 serine hydrolase [Polyangiaceae bacterium]HOR37585.1 serine hydrolase [Polyangiaceae bacterium]HPK95564.1 serine hydrolase [Polyangiaceae bacterium]
MMHHLTQYRASGILLLALALGGCGGGSGDESDTPYQPSVPDDTGSTTTDVGTANDAGSATNDAGTANDTGSTTNDAGTANDAGDADGTTDADEEPVGFCDPEQTAEIQARFEKDAPKNVDAVAFVKDPACGSRYFTRGPSKYPVTTPHLIASNTKMYVASLILMLADDGLLSLDDSISKWIDKVPGGNAITVRQTLNHTSGIADYLADYFGFGMEAMSGKKYTPQDLINRGFSKPVSFPPGEGWSYSNTNYVILGVIAEKVGGKPVEQQIRQRILEPIGAENTFFFGKETPSGDVAFGRTFLGGNGLTFWDPSASWCAGSYLATAEDLANFVERRSSGALHSAAANKELFATVEAGETLEAGPGLLIWDESITNGGGPAVGHGGDLPGYHSYALYYPDKKTTVVLIVDSDAGPGFILSGFPWGVTYREALLTSITGPLFEDTADAGQ